MPAPIAKNTDKRVGHVRGQPVRFISGHNRKGRGRRDLFLHQGRWRVVTRDGGHTLWSRIVMWNQLGHELDPNEVVHHRDEDTQNDDPDNLYVYSSNAEHMKNEHIDSATMSERGRLGNAVRWA